ncbi:MAG: (2Fe-2S) ferredoxin domain-containing protein [Bacteroidales bacterium]|jgi:NADH:ubiquinone oxidoreductase subunit E|nr:(2Fe-2S) ferredoxin domain-containing protein [Bacteroidales bacterium]
MFKKRKITLCLGSSCFARGNQEIIPLIKKYISRKCLEDKVLFIGDHCMSNCSQGPNLCIGDKLFEKIDKDSIEKILDEGLKDLD